MVRNFEPALSYAGSYQLTFEEFLRLASELGFGHVQIIPDQEPNLYSDIAGKRLKELCELRESLGLDIHVHNVFYDINFVSLIPAVRKLAFDITTKVLEICSHLSARTLTVHPGYMFPGWRKHKTQSDRFWEVVGHSLIDLADLSETYGIPVLLENGSYYLSTADGPQRTPLHVGISPEEMSYLVRLSQDRLGISLDVNKAIHSGYPAMEFVTKLGSSIKQVQLSTVGPYFETIVRLLDAIPLSGDSHVIVLEGGPDEASIARQLLWNR